MQSLRRWMTTGLVLLALVAPAAAQSTGQIDGTRLTHLVDVDGAAQASLTITGPFTGTITFKVQHKNRSPVVVDCFTPAAPTTAVNSVTGEGSWSCPVAGFHFLEVQFSAYTDGAATIYADTSNGGPAVVGGPGGGGSFDGVLLDAAGGDALTDTVNNALRVNIIAGAGSGGTAMTDDAAFTPATTSVTPAGAVFDDVAPDSVNEGDGGAVRMSANRNLYGTIRDAAGNERGANVNSSNQLTVSVDNTVTVASHAVTNAGTFATQVDGAALTALQLIDNIPITIGSSTSGQSGALVMGAVTTSAPTYTTAQSHPLSLDTSGALRVAITSGAGSGGTAVADDADFTAGTTSFTPFGGFYQSAVTACTDGDTCAAGITAGRAVKVHISNADGTSASLASDSTFGTSTYTEATTQGPLVGGIRNDSLDSLANTTNESAPLALNERGALYIQSTANASGGCTPGSSISAGAVLETQIKATAGQLYSITVTAIDATPVFLKIYNDTGANVDETDTPVQRFVVPSAATGGGITTTWNVGMAFSTAITFRITTGAADNDTGALTANEVLVSYCYL